MNLPDDPAQLATLISQLRADRQMAATMPVVGRRNCECGSAQGTTLGTMVGTPVGTVLILPADRIYASMGFMLDGMAVEPQRQGGSSFVRTVDCRACGATWLVTVGFRNGECDVEFRRRVEWHAGVVLTD